MAEVKDKLITVEGLGAMYNNITSNMSNPNLLINSNFANPINQRGGTLYSLGTNTGYTIDRWVAAASRVELRDGHIYVGQDIGINTTTDFYQNLEPALSEKLLGKTVTLSFETELDTYAYTIQIPDSLDDDYDYYSEQCYFDTSVHRDQHAMLIKNKNKDYFRLHFDVNSTKFKWIKLELGSVATPFVPRTYAQELDICKRYYRKLFTSAPIIYGYSARRFMASFQFEPMRVIPELKTFSVYTYNSSGNSMSSEGYEEINNHLIDRITLRFTLPQDRLSVTTGFSIYAILDAEIY